uniref:Cytochrome c biogenesis protein CcsA n=1 Tax=Xanthoceras sorbifolium TaxID=99658 RepID=A0A2P1FUF0_9ROSI|nr:cytochrome c heme attachment protein [Xanthoceras sorbifolium]AVM38971.1 cytochrome c heme attachment protein [Xanthoceras sorbifolium]QIM59513.1 CcsA [Xanthoceras sorbifolium]QMJ95939.1 cytochrome c heme attachment protein [Xanthoceras sorbifolium]
MKLPAWELIFVHVSFSVVSIGFTIYLITLFVDEFIEIYDSPKRWMIVPPSCLTGFLVTRWISSEYFPLSNLYESLIFLSCGFATIHSIFYFKKLQNHLSAITTPSTIFIQGFAASSLLTKLHPSGLLVPALQAQWLVMHVSTIGLGYLGLLFGALLSLALLVISFRRVIRLNGKRYNLKDKRLIWPVRPNFSSEINYFIYMNVQRIIVLNNLLNKNPRRQQLLQRLDSWSYRTIRLGFWFLTIGILAGALWANEAWGSYWSWDPKETWAFITWTIFGIYLHLRINHSWEGVNSAIVALAGFFIIFICYFGVNLLGPGLHSYGSFNF